MGTLARLARLDSTDWWLLVEAAAALLGARVALFVLPLTRIRGLVRRLGALHASRAASPDRVAWAVRAVGRRLPGGRSCLVQAFAAHALLTRRGVSSRVLVGVSPSPEGVRAHAWLETAAGSSLGAEPGRWTFLGSLTEAQE